MATILEMVTSARIEGLLDTLHRVYGEFPVESGEYWLDPDSFARVQELHEAGVPGAARVWVERGDEALFVREERRPESWGVAGGLIEPGETPTEAGEREVQEETGIKCSIFDIAYVHRATRYLEDEDGGPIEELAITFIAEYVSGEITPQTGEIRDAAWWSTLPETVHAPADRIATNRFD